MTRCCRPDLGRKFGLAGGTRPGLPKGAARLRPAIHGGVYNRRPPAAPSLPPTRNPKPNPLPGSPASPPLSGIALGVPLNNGENLT
jgi:hypothetical protein